MFVHVEEFGEHNLYGMECRKAKEAFEQWSGGWKRREGVLCSDATQSEFTEHKRPIEEDEGAAEDVAN